MRIVAVDEILELTPGLQCCLRCRRVLTDRALHDALEEPVLASIRTHYPELASPNQACQPCIEEYRSLLNDRRTRSERVREAERSPRPLWMNRWLRRGHQSSPSEGLNR